MIKRFYSDIIGWQWLIQRQESYFLRGKHEGLMHSINALRCINHILILSSIYSNIFKWKKSIEILMHLYQTKSYFVS